MKEEDVGRVAAPRLIETPANQSRCELETFQSRPVTGGAMFPICDFSGAGLGLRKARRSFFRWGLSQADGLALNP